MNKRIAKKGLSQVSRYHPHQRAAALTRFAKVYKAVRRRAAGPQP